MDMLSTFCDYNTEMCLSESATFWNFKTKLLLCISITF